LSIEPKIGVLNCYTSDIVRKQAHRVVVVKATEYTLSEHIEHIDRGVCVFVLVEEEKKRE